MNTDSTTLARIERLERQNSIMKRVGGLAALAVIGVVCAAATYVDSSFMWKDKAGHVLAWMGHHDGYTGTYYYSQGANGKNGDKKVFIGETKDDEPRINFYGDNGEIIMAIGARLVNGKHVPFIFSKDKTGAWHDAEVHAAIQAANEHHEEKAGAGGPP